MATKSTNTTLVPVQEVIAAGSNPYWLDRVGAKVIEDWSGRACVSAADAEKAVTAARKDAEENDRRHIAYRAYLLDRDRRRAAAGEEAVAKMRPRLLRRQQQALLASGTMWDNATITAAGQRLEPGSIAVLATVRRETFAEFDRKHPVKVLEDF